MAVAFFIITDCESTEKTKAMKSGRILSTIQLWNCRATAYHSKFKARDMELLVIFNLTSSLPSCNQLFLRVQSELFWQEWATTTYFDRNKQYILF